MNSITDITNQLFEKVVEKLSNLLKKTANTKSSKTKTISEQELLNMIRTHPCFTELSMWKVTKANNLNIADPSKKEMTKAYFGIISDVCEMNGRALQQMSIEQIAAYFEGSALPLTLDRLLDEITRKAMAQGIPAIFLDRNNEIISSYIGPMANAIADLQLYHHNQMSAADSIIVALDILYVTVRIIGEEVPRIVNSMNGELKMALMGTKYDMGQ